MLVSCPEECSWGNREREQSLLPIHPECKAAAAPSPQIPLWCPGRLPWSGLWPPPSSSTPLATSPSSPPSTGTQPSLASKKGTAATSSRPCWSRPTPLPPTSSLQVSPRPTRSSKHRHDCATRLPWLWFLEHPQLLYVAALLGGWGEQTLSARHRPRVPSSEGLETEDATRAGSETFQPKGTGGESRCHD